MGDGRPGIVTVYDEDVERDYYKRFGGCEYAEPLIHVREFATPRPKRIEVIEEFRLYFNLFYDKRVDAFVRTDDVGNDEEVIRLGDNRIEIRLRELKEFAALKEMHIASFFDLCRFSATPFSELGIASGGEILREELMTLSYAHRHIPLPFTRPPYLSEIVGKKLIPGLTAEKLHTRLNYRKKYAPIEFIVGVDDDGEPILRTCHGSNDSQPIFFRREVLHKYYDNPDKFAVTDGKVSCIGIWHCYIDNNHPKYVLVHFRDLSRRIPEEEPAHITSSS